LIVPSIIEGEWRDAVGEEREVQQGGLKRRPAITGLGGGGRGVKVRLLIAVTSSGNEGDVNAPSSIEGKLCSAAGEERVTRLGRRTQARGAGASSRTAGQRVHVQVVRLAGHSGDVRSVSGEREREGKQRGGTGFRCIVAHEGEKGGT
jgi:hypothetical protein